ncbi:hypothetical protein CAPTEDRAFT_178189 [Capitella teleta]|uniref:BZIP domain-containing protein n=1 Tax=Capitella teleta TaxID=283909 RepID=R7TN28_CAPTE|nr:hypothetical protein CAPTEDRAFT_178189 [Capitella teleta]|eukprot:ELT95044.1 hypothetical protein CAPTEDRAFT_178189 [Capitella teleta]
MKQQQQHQGKNGSTPRPFKTYPKDPLSLPLGVYNMPEMPPGVSPVDVAAANAMSANSEQLFSHYKHMVRQMQGDLSPGNRRSNQQKAVKERRSSDGSTSSQVSSTSAHSEQGSPAIPSHAPSGFSPPGGPGGQMPYPQTPSPKSSSGGSRKRPRTIPEELKDIAYWERRRKNNEAAKRSRDARRAKEDEIAIRAAFLEQENLKLRVEVAALKNETSKLRCMLYNS